MMSEEKRLEEWLRPKKLPERPLPRPTACRITIDGEKIVTGEPVYGPEDYRPDWELGR